jgi:hypothetical protein
VYSPYTKAHTTTHTTTHTTAHTTAHLHVITHNPLTCHHTHTSSKAFYSTMCVNPPLGTSGLSGTIPRECCADLKLLLTPRRLIHGYTMVAAIIRHNYAAFDIRQHLQCKLASTINR